MLFNSVSFAIFLPIVFILYWFVANRSLRLQNILLLVSSYYFYASWDWRFLFLLLFSTALDYYTGLKMSSTAGPATRKFWLWLSISVNLGFLGLFKYFNFFVTSFSEALAHLGLHIHPWTLNVILPIGISFYTFHGLSYVIDIYKDRIQPERDFINYSVFVSFFPLLVAGPIERATHLLPQIQKPRSFDYAKGVDGLRQILWGLFKKIVIADQCAPYVDELFGHPAAYSGSTLALGAIMFAFQIYCDFSGYSDVALGTARLFGIELLRNFAYPYFSRDIAEFWRRWHISLSSWFRDYLYIPLGGSDGGVWFRVRNILIIFLVSGFWHGANWTFIVWGLLNALYIIPSVVFRTNRKNMGHVSSGKYLPTLTEFLSMAATFGLTCFAWIFFRAKSLEAALDYISIVFSKSLITLPAPIPFAVLPFILIMVVSEWLGREKQHALVDFGLQWPRILRWACYYSLIVCIFSFGGSEKQFIYFQF